MKRIMILLAFMALLSIKVQAQEVKTNQLYWVVETNTHYRNYTIVRFYNRLNQQVHEVKVLGVYIDIRNPKQRKKLDQLLKDFNERVLASTKKNKFKSSI